MNQFEIYSVSLAIILGAFFSEHFFKLFNKQIKIKLWQQAAVSYPTKLII